MPPVTLGRPPVVVAFSSAALPLLGCGSGGGTSVQSTTGASVEATGQSAPASASPPATGTVALSGTILVSPNPCANPGCANDPEVRLLSDTIDLQFPTAGGPVTGDYSLSYTSDAASVYGPGNCVNTDVSKGTLQGTYEAQSDALSGALTISAQTSTRVKGKCAGLPNATYPSTGDWSAQYDPNARTVMGKLGILNGQWVFQIRTAS